MPGCLTAAHSGVRRRLSDSVYSVLAFRSSESRIIICFGQFLWKCYYLERMLEDYDGPHLLTDFPVHNVKPGERVVCSEHTAYGKLLDALTSPFTFLSVTSNIQVFILRSILICIKSKVTRKLAIKENNRLLLEYLDNCRPYSLNDLLSHLLILMLHCFSAKVMCDRSLNQPISTSIFNLE